MKHLSLLLILSLTAGITAAYATTNTSNRLHKINHKIATLRADIFHERQIRRKNQSQLKKIELSAAAMDIKYKKTEKNLNKELNTLTRLEKNAKQYQIQLNKERTELTKEIRAAYIIGRQPYLKLLFSQPDRLHISRALIYYRYLSNNEINTIIKLLKTLHHVLKNHQDIEDHTKVLKVAQNKQQQQRLKLSQIKLSRMVIIKKINRTIHTKSQKLSQLQDDKRQLETIILKIEKRSKILAQMKQNLVRLKGKLHWPTKGHLLNYYGTKIDKSELRWSGILIQAPENQIVHAIASGKVVFADWMSGYGLLMIINHGHGIMSLYGRNHTLLKKVGDMIQRGETIATVGKSGGYAKPALYFAIRKNATPVDPAKWCK